MRRTHLATLSLRLVTMLRKPTPCVTEREGDGDEAQWRRQLADAVALEKTNCLRLVEDADRQRLTVSFYSAREQRAIEGVCDAVCDGV